MSQASALIRDWQVLPEHFGQASCKKSSAYLRACRISMFCHDAKTPGLDRIHSRNAATSRKVFEFIFQGMVTQ